MSEPLPVDGFDWIKDLSKVNEDFIKNLIKLVIKDVFFKQMLNILKIYMNYIVIYHSYPEE